MTPSAARPSVPRTWHVAGCDIAKCVGAQRINGMTQGGCVACHCGHPLERHYQDRENEGCIECNAESIRTGSGSPCPRFRSLLTSDGTACLGRARSRRVSPVAERPSTPERLYGVPDAEELHLDLVDAYEAQVEPWVDEHDRRPRVIEEWTVHPTEYHLPDADRIVEWLVEWTSENGEVTEGFSDGLEDAGGHPDVLAAAEALRTALASHVTYRMADKRLAEHQITWDDQGEPLVNGEPMYVKSDPVGKGTSPSSGAQS